MAERALTLTPQQCNAGINAGPFGFLAQWSGLANGDTGATTGTVAADLTGTGKPKSISATDLIPYLDRTFQVEGDFGSGGGALVIEGTNDGSNWEVLNDPQGVALSFTAAGIRQVVEVVMQMRPRMTAGAAASVNVSAFYRKTTSQL